MFLMYPDLSPSTSNRGAFVPAAVLQVACSREYGGGESMIESWRMPNKGNERLHHRVMDRHGHGEW